MRRSFDPLLSLSIAAVVCFVVAPILAQTADAVRAASDCRPGLGPPEQPMAPKRCCDGPGLLFDYDFIPRQFIAAPRCRDRRFAWRTAEAERRHRDGGQPHRSDR